MIVEHEQITSIGNAVVGAGTVAIVEQLAVKLSPRNKVLVMALFAGFAFYLITLWNNREAD